MSNDSSERDLHEDCEQVDCFASGDRRRFLKDSFLAFAGALVAAGAPKAKAFAMPLDFTGAVKVDGSLHTYMVPPADGAQIDKSNDLILVRWHDAVFAFALSCPHQNTALRWNEKDHTFQCPKHKSKFTAGGDYIAGSGRATRHMDRLAIRKEGAGIVVDVDTIFEQGKDAGWTTAVVRLT